MPRAVGGGAELSREELLEAPVHWSRPSLLEAPITALRGVGPKLSQAAAGLGLETVGDVLRHLPREHRDAAEVSLLGDLRIGEEATVLVEVRHAHSFRARGRRLTIVEAVIVDASGVGKAVWFNRAWLADRLTPGTRVLLRGKLDKRGFTVSQHELLGEEAEDGEGGPRAAAGFPGAVAPPGLHTTGIVPIHPAGEGVNAQRLREWAWQAAGLAPHAPEPLPASLRARMRLPGAADALVGAHFPESAARAAEARRRLAFEELLLYQASLASRRAARRSAKPAPRLDTGAGGAVERWLATLPFEFTSDQRNAISEIDADLSQEQPMQRLLMGEVGSGKTVVALEAMLRAVENGHQAALMAPTETLAEQHLRTLQSLLAETAPPMALLTSALGRARRSELLGHLASGQMGLVVGTHALIEDDVRFASLAVAVIDEQHRFGVRQRAALDAKGPEGRAPHVLHMSATPIPRTLSLTAYGDLDATALHELPAGRRPVRTWAVAEDRRAGAYDFLRERLREGRQAYVVCPLVNESVELESRAAEAEAKRLAATELREFEVGLVHGQMPSERKLEAMGRFTAGGTDVLVATSVIEVGIDVPNATVIVIEGAERYGLSQLHQLRGRVGRGEHESSCILFSDAGSEAAGARLEAIVGESDGFRLAEIDLSLRGEGEVLGTRQHGLPRFRAASLPEDALLLVEARSRLTELLRSHGSLDDPGLGPLMSEARRRFGDERRDGIAA